MPGKGWCWQRSRKLYCAVCDNSSTIESVMQRQSNNFRPQFSDEECITVYLWGISQRRFEQKTIYEYTRNHLLEWFPKLPSYQAFSDRLNKLVPAFQMLAEHWLYIIGVNLHEHMEYIVDSCPIILIGIDQVALPVILSGLAVAHPHDHEYQHHQRGDTGKETGIGKLRRGPEGSAGGLPHIVVVI